MWRCTCAPATGGYIYPSVIVDNKAYSVDYKAPGYGAPTFTITTSGKGDVEISNFLALYNG